MQTDPVGYDDGPNLYTYVGGDPISYNDDTGTGRVRWFVETVAGSYKRVSDKIARSSREAHKNVSVRGPGQVGKGRRLEEKVQGSKQAVTRDRPHREGDSKHRGTHEDHFQPSNRKVGGKGHTFVGPPAAGVAAALASTMQAAAKEIGTWESKLDANASQSEVNTARVIDFFDPASNIAEILEVSSELIKPR